MLFGKRKKVLPALLSDEDIDFSTGVNYSTVLDYLVGLSGDDYTKICQVAAVYRQADYEACKVLGVENEPSTFITPAQAKEFLSAMSIGLEPEFLETPEKKPKKIKVKQ